MLGLSGEEIRESYADLCSACKEYPCIPTACYESKQCIAKAQLKKVVEWGDETCIEHSNDMWHRRECPKCWQALLEEINE